MPRFGHPWQHSLSLIDGNGYPLSPVFQNLRVFKKKVIKSFIYERANGNLTTKLVWGTLATATVPAIWPASRYTN